MLIIFITEKFDELFNKYSDASYIADRKIKVKLKEIIACQEECDSYEHQFTYEIIDKFCELISLIEDRNEDEKQILLLKYEGNESVQKQNLSSFVAYESNEEFNEEDSFTYRKAATLLDDFYNSFIEKKSASTMKDYVARIKTFACSNQYLNKMIRSGELGTKKLDIDPILFTYKNIEIILAKFDTKDENGVVIKQRNNIRSALRLLNEFKQK